MKIVRTSLLLASLACYGVTHGQDTAGSSYPSAVLVQLQSGNNKILALSRIHDQDAVEQLKHDVAMANKKMIEDFTKHYHGRPVYYYSDTDANLVKQKMFTGILMNADGSRVDHPVPGAAHNDYVIAYYGKATYQPRAKDKQDAKTTTYDPDALEGTGLVILNSDYVQIDHYYKMGYDDLFFSKRKKYEGTYFVSKKYNIEYFPFAAQFMRNFGNRYSRRRLDMKHLDGEN